MTEHKKIPLPGKGDDSPKETSLFERASGAFGFESFRAAPMPGRPRPRRIEHDEPVGVSCTTRTPSAGCTSWSALNPTPET